MKIGELRESDKPTRCAYCHAPAGATPITCEDCGTRLHAECMAALKVCPTLGCGRMVARPEDRPFDGLLRARGQVCLLLGPSVPLWSATLLARWAYHGKGPLRWVLGSSGLIPSWADEAVRLAFVPAVLLAFCGPILIGLLRRLEVSRRRRALLVLASFGLAFVALVAFLDATTMV